MLRDHLMCGIQQLNIQRRLLAEANLILKRALELVLAIESAVKDMRDIQKAEVSSTLMQIHMVDKRTHKFTSVKKPTYYRCGGNCLAPSCRFKDSVRRGCNKKGYLVRSWMQQEGALG